MDGAARQDRAGPLGEARPGLAAAAAARRAPVGAPRAFVAVTVADLVVVAIKENTILKMYVVKTFQELA